MWKRDEAVRPPSGQPTAAAPQPPAPAPQTGSAGARSDARPSMEKDIVNIGKSVVIKGELNGSEDLTIEGHVEGTIQLREHVLTIGPNGRIKAQVFAKSVIVLGEVTGNVTASDKVDIRDNGSVDGDIISPRVAIAEGAHFRGSVDMQRKGAAPAQPAKPAAAAATPPAAAQPAAAAQAPAAAAQAPAGAPAGQRASVPSGR
jgi:cytoskeletal protein CcmA (bactofilin family)